MSLPWMRNFPFGAGLFDQPRLRRHMSMTGLSASKTSVFKTGEGKMSNINTGVKVKPYGSDTQASRRFKGGFWLVVLGAALWGVDLIPGHSA